DRLRGERARLQGRDLRQRRARDARCDHGLRRGRAREPPDQGRHSREARGLTMATATIDGIATRYEVKGSGPPLPMYAPGGFDATVEKWTSLGVYARVKLMDHLPRHFTCIAFDRRECGQSGGRVETVTWSHFVRQGAGLLDHLEFDRAHLMGGCMGVSPVIAFGTVHAARVM